MVQQKRRKPRKTARFLNMLLLVFAFLVVFEGRLIINIASKGGINKQVDEQLNKIFSSSDFQNQDEATAESETSSETASCQRHTICKRSRIYLHFFRYCGRQMHCKKTGNAGG